MFSKNSRYYGLQTAIVDNGGAEAKAVKLRRIDKINGFQYMVRDQDSLDYISNQKYNDSTKFWYIADANSEMKANDLLDKTGEVICVPE